MPSQSVEHQDHCSQCNQIAPLLACDDDVDAPRDKNGSKPRFCNNCMIGKKVRVFWPVDESWYTGTVQQYDPVKGEHCLQYPDGDTEWVKIGEIIAASNANQNANNVGGGAPPPPPPPPIMTGVGAEDSVKAAVEAAAAAGRGGGAEPMPPSAPTSGDPSTAGGGGPSSSSRSPPEDRSKQGGWQGGPGDPNNGNLGGPPPYGVSYGYQPSSAYHHGGMGPPHAYAIAGPYPHPPPPPSSYHGYPAGPPPYGSSASAAAALAYSDSSHHHGGGRDGGGNSSNSPPDHRRKSGPKPWTKEEDALLMNLVHTMQWPMKWTVVAQSLPDRTGKQCRERYVNHLNPRLKNTDWTAVEDATIFHLYNTIGSHWAKMSKVIPGRTDNGIKNRFHNIRRQYEREDTHRIRLNAAHEHPEHVRLERLRKFPEHLTGKSTELWEMKQAVGVLAAQSVATSSAKGSPGRFGPFRSCDGDEDDEEDTCCVRCGFTVPSIQTGSEICTKTGWCQACTRIPPNISGNLLRECLNLRRWPHDDNVRAVIESWEEFFVPTDPAEQWPYQHQAQDTSGGDDADGDDNKDSKAAVKAGAE